MGFVNNMSYVNNTSYLNNMSYVSSMSYVNNMSHVNDMSIFMNHLKSNNFFSQYIMMMSLRHQKYKN